MSAKKSAFPVEPDSIRVSVDAWVESLESKTGELTRLGEIFHVTEDFEDLPDVTFIPGSTRPRHATGQSFTPPGDSDSQAEPIGWIEKVKLRLRDWKEWGHSSTARAATRWLF